MLGINSAASPASDPGDATSELVPGRADAAPARCKPHLGRTTTPRIDSVAVGIESELRVGHILGVAQFDVGVVGGVRTPQVSECHLISGEDCFLLKVHAPAIEALEAVLDEFLLYGQTISSFVVSTPVPPRTPSADRS